jgi:hypothetical protein
MRLDFNVLWVDDQPRRVDAQIKSIAKQMEEEGFEFKPTLCQDMAAMRQAISLSIFSDEIDLVLVDWDLGGYTEGQTAIAEIRESVRYKDVVFYSAQTNPEKLRELAFANGLEGVYCASRQDLVDEVVGVFESLVKKVLDLDHARGIVMGATSDIDYMVTECLVAMHQQLDAAGKKSMVEYATERLNVQMKDLQGRAARLQKAASIEGLLDDPMMFAAMDRLRFLSQALKTTFKQHNSSRASVTSYMENVVPKRNILGHQVLAREGNPRHFVDRKGNTFSLDEIRELRRLILNLRMDFRNLLAAASGSVLSTKGKPIREALQSRVLSYGQGTGFFVVKQIIGHTGDRWCRTVGVKYS